MLAPNTTPFSLFAELKKRILCEFYDYSLCYMYQEKCTYASYKEVHFLAFGK